MNSRYGIELAKSWCGGTKVGVARFFGVSKASVTGWGFALPRGYAYEMEVRSGGAVKADDLMTPSNIAQAA